MAVLTLSPGLAWLLGALGVLLILLLLKLPALARWWQAARLEHALYASEEALVAGNHQASLESAGRALAFNPRSVDAAVLYSSALLKLRHAKTAYAFLKQWEQEGADETGILRLLAGLALLEQGRNADAGRELHEAISLHPELRDEIRKSELGRIMFGPHFFEGEKEERGPTPGYT